MFALRMNCSFLLFVLFITTVVTALNNQGGRKFDPRTFIAPADLIRKYQNLRQRIVSRQGPGNRLQQIEEPVFVPSATKRRKSPRGTSMGYSGDFKDLHLPYSQFEHIGSLAKIPLDVIDEMLSEEQYVVFATHCIMAFSQCPEGNTKKVIRDLLMLKKGAKCSPECSQEEQERVYDIVYKLVMGYSTRYPTYWGRVNSIVGHLAEGLI